MLDDPLVHDVEAVLAPGDTLLLYTDGLTEAGAPARTLTTEDVGELLRARARLTRPGNGGELPLTRRLWRAVAWSATTSLYSSHKPDRP